MAVQVMAVQVMAVQVVAVQVMAVQVLEPPVALVSARPCVALGVLGIALVVESDDDGPSAPTIDRPDPAGPTDTGTTGTISTSGT